MFLLKSKINSPKGNICQNRLSEIFYIGKEDYLWRVYKHTGKENDHEDTKRHRAQQQNEVGKSKRKFKHKLTQNIKSDRAYSALYKFGPLCTMLGI